VEKDPALLKRRLEIGVVEKKEKTQKIIQGFAFIGFVLFLLIPALDHRFGWSNVPLSIVILDNILVAVGFYLVFLVYKENTFASATIEITTSQKVITTGPYSMVRHPMYLGALIMLFGIPLCNSKAITIDSTVLLRLSRGNLKMTNNRKPKQSANSGLKTDEYLRAVTVGEIKSLSSTVYLSHYDPCWPSQFLWLSTQIREALSEKVLLLEHVGSTSVPWIGNLKFGDSSLSFGINLSYIILATKEK
jgi:protein-S-isoprenylcysteine O-methyltransferase Ste14